MIFFTSVPYAPISAPEPRRPFPEFRKDSPLPAGPLLPCGPQNYPILPRPDRHLHQSAVAVKSSMNIVLIAILTTSPGNPSSATKIFDPPPRLKTGMPLPALEPAPFHCQLFSQIQLHRTNPLPKLPRRKKRALPPTLKVVSVRSGMFSRMDNAMTGF